MDRMLLMQLVFASQLKAYGDAHLYYQRFSIFSVFNPLVPEILYIY